MNIQTTGHSGWLPSWRCKTGWCKHLASLRSCSKAMSISKIKHSWGEVHEATATFIARHSAAFLPGLLVRWCYRSPLAPLRHAQMNCANCLSQASPTRRIASRRPRQKNLAILRMIFILAWPPSTAARPQTAHSHWQNLSVTFATLDAATGRTAGVAVFKHRSIQFIFRA